MMSKRSMLLPYEGIIEVIEFVFLRAEPSSFSFTPYAFIVVASF